jgi:hypothetical protein
MASSSTTEIPASFSMSIIRNKSDTTSKTDDVISVRRDGQYFTLRYKDKNQGINQSVSMTAGDVYKYLKNTLTLLENDDEPFSHVQFNFPATPSVMYKMENLVCVTDVLLEQFDMLLSNWPINA